MNIKNMSMKLFIRRGKKKTDKTKNELVFLQAAIISREIFISSKTLEDKESEFWRGYIAGLTFINKKIIKIFNSKNQ
jgi:hypothetical protein